MAERTRCQGGWSVHTVEGWHKVTTEHDCTKSLGHDRACRCACGMPDPATKDEPDWMHDLSKPWGIAALKPITGSPSGGPEPLEGT